MCVATCCVSLWLYEERRATGERAGGHRCDVYHPGSVWVKRELFPLFLCRCKLTFICQGPIHKNISFMIASGTSPMQWQMSPTMSTINEPNGAQLMGLNRHEHLSWYSVKPETTFLTGFGYIQHACVHVHICACHLCGFRHICALMNKPVYGLG